MTFLAFTVNYKFRAFCIKASNILDFQKNIKYTGNVHIYCHQFWPTSGYCLAYTSFKLAKTKDKNITLRIFVQYIKYSVQYLDGIMLNNLARNKVCWFNSKIWLFGVTVITFSCVICSIQVLCVENETFTFIIFSSKVLVSDFVTYIVLVADSWVSLAGMTGQIFEIFRIFCF